MVDYYARIDALEQTQQQMLLELASIKDVIGHEPSVALDKSATGVFRLLYQILESQQETKMQLNTLDSRTNELEVWHVATKAKAKEAARGAARAYRTRWLRRLKIAGMLFAIATPSIAAIAWLASHISIIPG